MLSLDQYFIDSFKKNYPILLRIKTPANPPTLAIITVNNSIKINRVLVKSLPGVSMGSELKNEYLINKKINIITANMDNPAKRLTSRKTSLKLFLFNIKAVIVLEINMKRTDN